MPIETSVTEIPDLNPLWPLDDDSKAIGANHLRNLKTAVKAPLNQASTGFHYPQSGAHIQRLNDRVMVGGATVSDLLFPNVVQDWYTIYQIAAGLTNGSILSAQGAALTSTDAASAVGFLAGSQSLHFTSAGSACIGLSAAAVNNNTTLATKAWGVYVEAHRENITVGQTLGMEIDARTRTASVTPHPGQQGDVVGIQLGVGAELSAFAQSDASSGIQFVANPQKWKKGIVFMHDSLTGSSAGVGESCAIAMAMTQNLEWFTSAGVRHGFIKFNTATAANRTGITSNDFGMFIVGDAEQPLMLCPNVASAVNYPQLVASIAGAPVQIYAQGSDTDRDLWLRTGGAGVARFGTLTASADAPVTGYITIKDSGGTVRKLAVIA